MVSEFYDELGKIASYALSVGDLIVGQVPENDRLGFQIMREDEQYEVSGTPHNRYFTIEHHIRLTDRLQTALERDHDLLAQLIEQYDIDEREHPDDEQLKQIAALYRVANINSGEQEKILTELQEYMSQTPCRKEWLLAGQDDQIWDGIKIQYQIYPYEERFSLSEYDPAVQTTLNVVRSTSRHINDELQLLNQDTPPTDGDVESDSA